MGDRIKYLGSADGGLYSLGPNAQQELVAKVDGRINHVIEMDENICFSTSHSIYIYKPATGEKARLMQTDEEIDCMAALDGIIYFGSTDYMLPGEHWLNSYNLKTKRQKSLFETQDRIEHIDVVGRNLLFSGTIYNPKTGELGILGP